MAHRVVGPELRQLVTALEKQLPRSVRIVPKTRNQSFSRKVYGIASSCVRNLIDNVELWTDDWPDFRCVLAKIISNQGSSEIVKKDLAAFATHSDACSRFLSKNKLVQWPDHNVFGGERTSLIITDPGVSDLVLSSISKAAAESGEPMKASNSCYLLEHTQQSKTENKTHPLMEDSCCKRLPPAFSITSIQQDDIPVIISKWKFATIGAEKSLSQDIKSLPSAALRSANLDDTKLIGWVMMGPDLIIEKLHIESEYRRRGFGAVLVTHLMNDMLRLDIVPRTIVECDNDVSIGLFQKLGFKLVLTEDLRWVRVGNFM